MHFLPTVLLPLALLLSSSTFVSARSITVKNNKGTIWPALFTSSGEAPRHATGWQAKKGTKQKVEIAENWSGRIWARTGCKFKKGEVLPTSCETGGCNGGLKCNKSGGMGVPPATLAKFTFTPSLDWYDISIVDGSNLPMSISNNKKCPAPKCKKDINKGCPAALSHSNEKGKVVGCLTSCAANLDGNPGNSRNCCSGAFNRPETCPIAKVAHYNVFKNACPDAYAYAYDESSNSALWTCEADKEADYTVTFCKYPSSGHLHVQAPVIYMLRQLTFLLYPYVIMITQALERLGRINVWNEDITRETEVSSRIKGG
ncbi:thaumatin family protein [Sporobolomyces salmoneus]|uniref:thaumatin family protein n=1 Tax=Sporobolomyces salmoneus TaxID=183962 RepID=UPI00316BFE4D